VDDLANNPETLAGVRAVALALLPEAPRLGVEVAAHVAERLPEFGKAAASALLVESCQANGNAVIDGLARNVPMQAVAPTVEVRQLTRALVQQGVPLSVLMRGYRIGVQYWIELWAAAVRRHVGADHDAVAVAQVGTSFSMGWLDAISEDLAEEYREEAERLARARSLAHVEHVRRALLDADLEVTAASELLGYDLNGRHVALVLRHQDRETGGADASAAARQLSAAISNGRPLIVRVDIDTTWCWVPYKADSPPRVPSLDAWLVAHGRPRRGIAGFRESHREALAASRVAELAQSSSGVVTSYDDAAVASLCSADPEWCRRFIRAELGALIADDAATRRVRATLEEFFAADSNFRATAARLGVHHNTVRYRLERAEKMLSRPPAERRLALELALHLASQLGPWALRQDDVIGDEA